MAVLPDDVDNCTSYEPEGRPEGTASTMATNKHHKATELLSLTRDEYEHTHTHTHTHTHILVVLEEITTAPFETGQDARVQKSPVWS